MWQFPPLYISLTLKCWSGLKIIPKGHNFWYKFQTINHYRINENFPNMAMLYSAGLQNESRTHRLTNMATQNRKQNEKKTSKSRVVWNASSVLHYLED